MLGKEHDDCWVKEKDGKNRAKVGCWYLDYNAIYGGAVVHEMMNEGGGVNQPFGSTRRKPRDFCDAVSMVEHALEIKTGRRR